MRRPRRCRRNMRSSAASAGFTFEPYLQAVKDADLTPLTGRVVRVVGLLIESLGPRARVGDVCEVIGPGSGEPRLRVEVVGFREGYLQSVPLGGTAGIRPGDRIV